MKAWQFWQMSNSLQSIKIRWAFKDIESILRMEEKFGEVHWQTISMFLFSLIATIEKVQLMFL